MLDLSHLFAKPGANDMAWSDPVWPGRLLVLRSARPRCLTPRTALVFAHHGVGRNGDDYRDYWLDQVDAHDLMVIAPEFPTDRFPGVAWYNFGNRVAADGNVTPREAWTYSIDQRLFADLRAQGLTAQSEYGIFGHSAGSQFVHRMISLGFRDHVRLAVAANAGTYAFPDPEIAWPYGLGGTGIGDLAPLFAFPLLVMAGTSDTDTSSPNFPKEPAALAQGSNRFTRAQTYHARAHEIAASLGVACQWRFDAVEGVNHDGCRMTKAAAPLLAEALHGVG